MFEHFYYILFSIKGVHISCLPYSMSIYLPLHTKVVNIACKFNIIIFHCIQIYLWLYHCKGGISCLDMVSYLLTVAQTKMSVYADFVQNLLFSIIACSKGSNKDVGICWFCSKLTCSFSFTRWYILLVIQLYGF